MRSTTTCLLLFSVVVAILAFIVTIIPQYWIPTGDVTYCYDSITTLSDNNHLPSNCFTVAPSGLFSRLFLQDVKTLSPGIQKKYGHVIPGLWDGHGHLLQYGEFLNSVDLFGVKSLDEATERVVAYSKSNAPAGSKREWIRGVGWDQAAFGRYPVAADLEADPRLKSKYIMLDRVDVHCIWVSNKVLGLLPADLPEIPGGEIIKDPGPGVFCDNAMDLVMQYWPRPDTKRKRQFVKMAMQELNKVGLVGMHDAGVTPKNLQLYEDMAGGDDWSLRVYAMLECEKRNTYCPEDSRMISREDGMLNLRSVKLFADGALGSWGSAMIDPYSDRPSTTGSLLINASTLTALTHSWSEEGFQVNIHAIGDLANRLAIDAMEDVYETLCKHESYPECQARLRFRIEHAQIIHPDDQRRMLAAGIIPSIQPTHATSDMYYAEDRLGKKRTNEEAYRMHSLLPIRPVLGSDFPVEPPNPFEGIFAAVTRRSPKTGLDKDGGKKGWNIEQALTMDEALRGFTIAPSYGAFLEGKAGVIQEDAFADWVVLDEPLNKVNKSDLRNIKVRETWVKGKRVYHRRS